ncbi:Gfo/Idh/MocA family oxidoreductase [Enterobacter sp. Ap-916]|uniref:Gfo/Idh/MocA family protein n=1 Tax=unclassified Enterobacter TaxID=2608935 RepID=UPI0014213E28|nr:MULTISPECIES: Gfo/Idh/MocA family oxidoreductase [unclassified Enterobacter]NIF58471.1 Gfo/Idh/MocA family oxidoreductase [Enterobacter sp. Ap-867]NIG30369.1 Gfo/Idh/MocA family oxidoreductase [Enterobacter sp. Ap-916]
MIRFAVIGTNWITRQFVDAAHESGKFKLTAVYSRSLEQAQSFANDYPVEHLFTSLDELAQSDAIDAVYIASPNSLHGPQSLLFLSHKKHVICEKPLASNLAEVEAAIACARENQVVLFEAFKTASLPNFIALQQALPKVGKIRKVLLNYCQYSSRYQRYLDGENPNTFNPAFSNGSIMDIGFYVLASAAALWGEPQAVHATASLLDSGVDAHGTVQLNYGDFDVTLLHSKVSDSTIPSEIQGEAGSLVIEKISECQRVTFIPRGGKPQDLSLPQHINTMLYEAETFARLVEENEVNHAGLVTSRITSALATEIRRQTGVKFPADDVDQQATA